MARRVRVRARVRGESSLLRCRLSSVVYWHWAPSLLLSTGLVWFGLSSLAAMEILVNFEYFPSVTPPPTQPPALNLYKYDEGSQHVLLFVLFAASAVAATKFIHNGFFTALQPLLQRPLLLPPLFPPTCWLYSVYKFCVFTQTEIYYGAA